MRVQMRPISKSESSIKNMIVTIPIHELAIKEDEVATVKRDGFIVVQGKGFTLTKRVGLSIIDRECGVILVEDDDTPAYQLEYSGANENAQIYTVARCYKHRISFYSSGGVRFHYYNFKDYSDAVCQKKIRIMLPNHDHFNTIEKIFPKRYGCPIGTIDLNVFKQEEVLKELPEMLDKLGYKKEDSAAILKFTQDFYASKKKTEYDEAKKKGLSLQSGPETEWTQRLQHAKKIDEESNSGIRYRLLLLQTLFAQKVKPSFQQEWLLAFGDLKNLTSAEQLALARELSLCKEIPFVVIRLLKSVLIHKSEILLSSDKELFLKLALAYLKTIPKENPLRHKLALECFYVLDVLEEWNPICDNTQDNRYPLWLEVTRMPLPIKEMGDVMREFDKSRFERQRKMLIAGLNELSNEWNCAEQKASEQLYYKLMKIFYQYACVNKLPEQVGPINVSSLYLVEPLAPKVLWQRYMKTEERQQQEPIAARLKVSESP